MAVLRQAQEEPVLLTCQPPTRCVLSLSKHGRSLRLRLTGFASVMVAVVLAIAAAGAQEAPVPGELFPTAPGPDSPAARDFLELVSQAARRHPDYGAALSRIGESQGARREVAAVRYPQVEAGIDVVGSLTNRTSVGGEERRIDRQSLLRPDAVLSVSQLIFDAGSSYHRIAAVKARTGAAEADAAVALNDAALRALAAYFDVLRYRLAVRIATDNLREHHRLTDLVVERADSRVGSLSDALRAESRSTEARAQLILSTGELRRAEAAFVAMFGALEETLPPPLPVPDGLMVETRAIELALAHNPSLRSTRRLVEAARAELTAERRAGYPSVTLEVNGRQFDVTAFDDQLYDVGARFVVRHKLFSGGAASGRRQQAAARLRQARYQEQSQRLSVERLVRASLADVYARRQRVRAFGLSVATNLEARAAYEQQFVLARTTFMDMLDIQRELFTAQLQWLNAIVDLHLAGYSMAAATGDLLPFLGLFHLAGDGDGR